MPKKLSDSSDTIGYPLYALVQINFHSILSVYTEVKNTLGAIFNS